MQNSELLNKHGFKFNKRFGQNFIFDTNLLNAIATDAGVTETTNVLEIGPGAGTLTKVLSVRAAKVIAYEIDENLKQVLSENLAECNNIQVVYKDFLKENLTHIEKLFNNQPYIVVANLPYYITTPIIFKLLEESTCLTKLVIMVQKEVGERLIAKPGTKDYGSITVSIGVRADVTMPRIVKRTCFTPAPNVDSCIVCISFNENKLNVTNKELLNKLIRSAFAMRRKTLLNNVKGQFNVTQDKMIECLKAIGKPEDIRGEALSIAEFAALSNEIDKRS